MSPAKRKNRKLSEGPGLMQWQEEREANDNDGKKAKSKKIQDPERARKRRMGTQSNPLLITTRIIT
eukprot:scaffold11323_cov69-Skeletonema_dohrnii-CCMP3373.AAC.1